MFKKILALFLFTCLLLSATGCGNKQQAAEESGSFRETADVTNGDDSRNTTEEAASSPSEQEDAPASAPVQETKESARPEPTPQPEFDVEYWVSFAKSYAESIGLELDGSAIWCWDTPIVAGSHCLYLERDITDRLTRYKEGGDISKVWIWSEPREDGSYNLYIGYA